MNNANHELNETDRVETKNATFLTETDQEIIPLPKNDRKAEETKFSMDLENPPINIKYDKLQEHVLSNIQIRSAKLKKLFKEKFGTKENKEIMELLFWYCFVGFFQKGDLMKFHDNEFIQQLGHKVTLFFWSIPPKEKSNFFQLYHVALSYCIVKSLKKHFPGSKKTTFSKKFYVRIYQLVSEIFTGIRMNENYLAEQKKKLFPVQKRDFMQKILRSKVKSNRGYYSSSDDDDIQDGPSKEDLHSFDLMNDLNNLLDVEESNSKLNEPTSELMPFKNGKRKNPKKIHFSALSDSHNGENNTGSPKMLNPKVKVRLRFLANINATKKKISEQRRKQAIGDQKTSPRLDTKEFRQSINKIKGQSKQLQSDAVAFSNNSTWWTTCCMSPLISMTLAPPVEFLSRGKKKYLSLGDGRHNHPHFFYRNVDPEKERRTLIQHHNLWSFPHSKLQYKYSLMRQKMQYENESKINDDLTNGMKVTEEKSAQALSVMNIQLKEIKDDKSGEKLKELCKNLIENYVGKLEGNLSDVPQYQKVNRHAFDLSEFQDASSKNFRGTQKAVYAQQHLMALQDDLKKMTKHLEKTLPRKRRITRF